MASFDWTDDTIARLRALWDEGHATAEIGRRMGISKNAVVGKAHRLSLPARPSPIRMRVAGSERQARLPRPPRPAPSSTLQPLPSATGRGGPMRPVKAPPAPLPVRAGPSGQPCCWPLGDPGQPGFRFCGDGTAPGRPYCPEHAGLAYLPRAARDGGIPRRSPGAG